MVAWKHYYCRVYLMVILYSHHYFESYELVFHCYARTSLTPHLLNTFYNSVDHIECNLLLPLIFCSNVPDVTSGSYSCVLSTYFHHLLVLPYFLAPQDVPLLHFIHIFPVLALESCISIRILVLFYWILVHRNQYPGTWHAHHYWSIIASRPLCTISTWQQSLEITLYPFITFRVEWYPTVYSCHSTFNHSPMHNHLVLNILQW